MVCGSKVHVLYNRERSVTHKITNLKRDDRVSMDKPCVEQPNFNCRDGGRTHALSIVDHNVNCRFVPQMCPWRLLEVSFYISDLAVDRRPPSVQHPAHHMQLWAGLPDTTSRQWSEDASVRDLAASHTNGYGAH